MIECVQANINRYWGRRADSYDTYRAGRLGQEQVRRVWAEAWARALPAPPAAVLDVGTGTGQVALLLAELGHDVTGIDLAQEMIERARGNAAGMGAAPALQVGDAVAPDFRSASFDAITSRYVLWTLREPATALGNWRRLRRTGGTLAAVDSTWFPDGVHAGAPPEPSDTRAEFRALYDDRVLAALPLAQARTIDDTVALVRAAGFTGVALTPLEDVLELDRQFGVAPDHRVQMQFMITGKTR